MHLRPRRRLCAALAGAAAAAILALATTASLGGLAAYAPTGTLPGLHGGRVWSVAASPKSAGLVIAGTDSGVYVSTDSGADWQQTSLHALRVWAVGFDARDPSRLFAGTDGSGVWLSTDSGATWASSSTGLTDQTVRTLAFGLDGVAAGTDHGVALSPDGVTWHDGGLDQYSISSLAVAANSPSLVLIAAADAGNTSNGYLFRYTGGVSWQALQSGLPSVAVVTAVAAGPLSTSVPKRPLVVTTNKGVFRSGDGGSTWSPSTGVPQNLNLTAVTFSPLDPTLVYAGADQGSSSGGDVLRSTDGGSSFAVADEGLPSAHREVETIAVEQVTPPLVLIGLDPSSGGRVYSQVDTTAPAPPPLVAEAPGATIPATLATPVPTPHPHVTRSAPPIAAPEASGLARAAGAAFHWPMPLVLEVLLVLSAAYLAVRWRQRYYVEGPP